MRVYRNSASAARLPSAVQGDAAAHAARHARQQSLSLDRLTVTPAPANDAGRSAHNGTLPPYLVCLVARTPGLGEAIAAARAKLDTDINRERQREALMRGGAAW